MKNLEWDLGPGKDKENQLVPRSCHFGSGCCIHGVELGNDCLKCIEDDPDVSDEIKVNARLRSSSPGLLEAAQNILRYEPENVDDITRTKWKLLKMAVEIARR